MNVRTRCPHCSAVYRVPAALLKRNAKCKHCREPFEIARHEKDETAIEGSFGEGNPRHDNDRAEQSTFTIKECPFCAETIHAKANKCRFCGEYFLNESSSAYQTKVAYLGENDFLGAPTTAPAPLAPNHPVDYAATSVAVTYAGFWKRLAACLIDFFIMLVPTFTIGFVIGLTLAMEGSSDEEIIVIGYLLDITMQWLYFAFMESSKYQATLGKLAVGIKVIDLNGQRISIGRATGRHFGKIISGMIFAIGFLMAGFGKRKQTLHDMLADCLVVNRTIG